MYEQHFSLSKRPFNVCPQTESFFSSEAHRQSIDAARNCIQRGNGPVVLIGGVGAGKTLILQMIADEFSDGYDVVSIECSRLEQRSELLQNILFGLNMDFRDMSEGELRLSLLDYLKNGKGADQGMLLLVDEADRLSIELLDELRLITNVARQGQSQVQLVISGTQRLEESLNDPRLASFNQRVALRTYLQHLSRSEVEQYIDQHISHAGRNSSDVFDADATEEIAKCTDGCPRLINQLCEHTLTTAATEQANSVDLHTVRRSWAELQNLPAPSEAQSPNGSNTDSSQGESVLEFGSLDGESFDESPYAETQDVDLEQPPEDSTSEVEEETPTIADEVVADDELETPVDPFVTQTIAPTYPHFRASSDEQSDDWNNEVSPSFDVQQYREKTDSSPMPFSISPAGSGDPFAPSEEAFDEDNPQQGPNVFSSHAEQLDEDASLLDESETEFDSSVDSNSDSPSESHGDTNAEPYRENSEATTDQKVEALEREQQELFSQVAAGSVFAATAVSATAAYGFQQATGTGFDTGEADVHAAFESLSDHEAPQPPTVDQPQQYSSDPFDEEFEEEVVIHDAYSPFVAQQNRSSLTVTSDNLSHLTPRDEVTDQPNGAGAVDSTDAGDSTNLTNTNETAKLLEEPFNYTPSPADANFVPVQSVQTELSLQVGPEDESTNISDLDGNAGEPSEDQVSDRFENEINTNDMVESNGENPDELTEQEIDPELVALTSDFPFDDDADFQNDGSFNQESPVDTTTYFNGQGDTIPSPVHSQPHQETVGDSPQDQAYRNEPAQRVQDLDEAVQGQAEDLARELRSDLSDFPTTETVGNLPLEDYGLASLNQHFQSQQEPNENNQPEVNAYGQDVQSSTSPVDQKDQSLKILSDLMAKQNLSRGQQNDALQDESPTPPMNVDSVSVEYPITDHETYQTPSNIENDDRDMLRVNESQFSHSSGQEPLPPSPLTESEPSTGEARRMDYEQLFDQLRNLPKQ